MKIYHCTNHDKIEPNPSYDYNRASQGLGFYFTSCKIDASKYGKNCFERNTDKYRILKDQITNYFSDSDIEGWLDVIKERFPDNYDNVWTNWHEHEQEARQLLINSIQEQADNNPVKQFQAFESELFIRDTANWNQIAQALGIDGIEIKDPYKTNDKDLVHVVMYC